MKVHVYLRNMKTREGISVQLLAAVEGFRRHGIEPVLLEPGRAEPCDLAVCWGVKKRLEMRSGRRALIFERGYIGDRMETWTSVGYDGLNGLADFMNANAGPERWNRYHDGALKPWRESGGNLVVIMGQVPGDASLRGLNFKMWAQDVAERLMRRGLRVAFKPHPLWRMQLTHPRIVNLRGSMESALDRARWVVTYNSNAGVLSTLAGVRTVTCHEGAMAWPVTGHIPTEEPPEPDREAWAHRMAWTQWTPEELERGDWWDHLRGGME